MKLYPFLLFSLLILFSCGEESASEQKNINEEVSKTIDTLASNIDSIIAPNKELNLNTPSQKFLSEFFIEDFVISFNKVDQKLKSITTSKELKSYQKEIEKFIENFKESFIKKDKRQSIFGAYYTYADSFNILQPTCFEECMVFGFNINKQALVEHANTTESLHDDNFYKYQAIAEKHLMGAWEEGGNSFLGDSSTFVFLEETYSFISSSNPFYEEYLELRKQYLNNMYRNMYRYNSVEALREADLIIAANYLTKEELDIAKEAKEKINTCQECQFDCLEKGCTW